MAEGDLTTIVALVGIAAVVFIVAVVIILYKSKFSSQSQIISKSREFVYHFTTTKEKSTELYKVISPYICFSRVIVDKDDKYHFIIRSTQKLSVRFLTDRSLLTNTETLAGGE